MIQPQILPTNISNHHHMPVHVSNEISQLRRVIIHRPDEGIARISPKRAEELLFDDIVYLPKMQEEHDIFRKTLEAFIGAENVLETRDLMLAAIQHDQDNKEWVIDQILLYEELPQNFRKHLKDLSDEELTDVLITGYDPKRDHYLFDPIPNFIFTRDIAVTINDHILITKASKEARYRENFLTRFMIYGNPIFSKLKEENRFINLNHVDEFPPSKRGEYVGVEGGDVMILNKDYLLVGYSERTTQHGIHSLRDALFHRGVVKNVVQVNIPADRSIMHIDTVFTQIDNDDIVCYKPLVLDGLASNVVVHRDNGTTMHYHSIAEFLRSEINPQFRFILAGNGESPYQEREQWTDGCNLVAIRPGVALTYDRNPHTEIAFREAGYDIVHATDFLKQVEAETLDPQQIRKTIITLPSNELSRARGGSHCMTCPIERE